MVPTSIQTLFTWPVRYLSTSKPDLADDPVAADESGTANFQLASLQYCTPSGVEQDSLR